MLIRLTWQLLIVMLVSASCAFADWRQFRGNDSSGVVADANLPIEWVEGDAAKNIAWKIALPGRGLSSPIIVGDRVFVTCSSGFQQDRLHVLCFDVKEGRKLWLARIDQTPRAPRPTRPEPRNRVPQ